ncbi:MAG TPA: hypothetical protein VHA56_12670 [Mucilaginibacter sp.]|nr:hypothetical protein [Mucilaginibacter sp.]
MRKNLALLLPVVFIGLLTSCKKNDTSTSNNNSNTNNNNNTSNPTYYFKAKLNGTSWEADAVFVSASIDNGRLHLVGGKTSSTAYSGQISIDKYKGVGTYKGAKEMNIGFTLPNIMDGFQTRADDSVSIVKILSDDGKTITGTFSGVLFDQNTSKNDSMIVTEGSFSTPMI